MNVTQTCLVNKKHDGGGQNDWIHFFTVWTNNYDQTILWIPLNKNVYCKLVQNIARYAFMQKIELQLITLWSTHSGITLSRMLFCMWVTFCHFQGQNGRNSICLYIQGGYYPGFHSSLRDENWANGKLFRISEFRVFPPTFNIQLIGIQIDVKTLRLKFFTLKAGQAVHKNKGCLKNALRIPNWHFKNALTPLPLGGAIF